MLAALVAPLMVTTGEAVATVGAEVVDVTNRNGDTPLMFAAMTVNVPAVTALLAAGCVSDPRPSPLRLCFALLRSSHPRLTQLTHSLQWLLDCLLYFLLSAALYPSQLVRRQ